MENERQIRIQQLHVAYREFEKVNEILHQDVQYCAEMLTSADNLYWRRGIVKATFAFIEGAVYRMKQISLACSQQPGVEFTLGELTILTERSFELDGQGVVNEKVAKASLKGNIRFAFSAFARAHLATFELDLSREDGWGAFRKSINLRDRLTHPKRTQDLSVTDEELDALNNCLDWFISSVTQVQRVGIESLTETQISPNDAHVEPDHI